MTITHFLAYTLALAVAGTASAQAPTTKTSPTPTAAPNSIAPTPEPAPTPAAAPAVEEQAPEAPAPSPTSEVLMPQASSTCFPGCRKGFLCSPAGECVSQCNPVCGSDETCTADLECVPKQPTEALPEPGAEAHDGFYLHLAIGIGGGGAERQTGGGKVRYEGGAGLFSVDVGGSPVENLVIFGRISSFSLAEPTIDIDGARVPTSDDDGLSFGMLGVGAAYYFMPINLFVGGAIGLASASTHAKDDDDSKAGFGLNLDVGKEWWISDQWGLGVALRLTAANVPPGEDWGAPNKHLTAGALGVLFSATYQ